MAKIEINSLDDNIYVDGVAKVDLNDVRKTSESYSNLEVDTLLNGDNTKTFKVADGVNADDAVSKGQLVPFVLDANYVDLDAVGANPTAVLYSDGIIVGSTDNGSYTKYPNGDAIIKLKFTFAGTIENGGNAVKISTVPIPITNFNDVSFSVNGTINNSVVFVFNTLMTNNTTATFSIRNDSGATRNYEYKSADIIGRWK